MSVHTALGFGTELLRYAQSGLSDCLGMTERGERRMSSASCRIAGSLPGGWLSIAYLLLLALPWPAVPLFTYSDSQHGRGHALWKGGAAGDCLHAAHDAVFVRRPHLFMPQSPQTSRSHNSQSNLVIFSAPR